MRTRALSAVTIGVVVLLAIIAVVGIQKFSFSKQPMAVEENTLRLLTADRYLKGEPRGIRLSMQLNTSELKIDETNSFELDIMLAPELAKLFEVADSAVSTEKEGFAPRLQPYHNQSPPEGVQARLLLPPGKRDTYNLELFLAPKDGKTEPDVGLEYLSNAANLNRNVQVKLVAQ